MNRRDVRIAIGYVVTTLAIAAFALDGTVTRVAGAVLLIGSVIVLDGGDISSDRGLGLVILAVALASGIGVVFNVVKVGLPLLFHWMLVVAGPVVGYAMARRKGDEIVTLATALLVTYQAVLLLQIARGAVDLNGLSLPGASGSTNMVSGILLFLQLWQVASVYTETGRSPVLLPLLSAILAIPMKGRSGIALLGALALYCLLQRWSLLGGRRRLTSAVIAAALVAGISLVFGDSINTVVQSTRLIHGFGDESRAAMRAEYLASLDGWGILLGGRYDGSPEILTLAGNPHNSFIRAHYFFGLPVLLCLAALVAIVATRAARAPGERWFLPGLLVLYAARAFVDAIAFPGLLDFLFFYLLFLMTVSAPAPTPSFGRPPNSAISI